MTQEEKWNAVIGSDGSADGRFYYAVSSTGIYCRPSCKSKTPSKQNVVFFDTRQEAQSAGFRPCKRCRPELDEYKPLADIAAAAKNTIEDCAFDRKGLETSLSSLGLSRRRLDQIFQQSTGFTIAQYADRIKIQSAKERLLYSDETVLEIALALGFESLPAFFAFFFKHEGLTPGEFRSKTNAQNCLFDNCFVYNTAIGPLTIGSDASSITLIRFGGNAEGFAGHGTTLTDEAAAQIGEYLAGKRTQFNLPMSLKGTAFQRSVWEALREIPYGQTRSYQEIAQSIGNGGASRAVGMANNKNPLPMLIPCHRVIGANGSLTGYAGGLALKQRLLELERANAPQHECICTTTSVRI